jgi:hypothetical protein
MEIPWPPLFFAAVAEASQARHAMEQDAVADLAKDESMAGELVDLTAAGASELEGGAELTFGGLLARLQRAQTCSL